MRFPSKHVLLVCDVTGCQRGTEPVVAPQESSAGKRP